MIVRLSAIELRGRRAHIQFLSAVDHGLLTPEGVQNLVRMYEDVHCDRHPEQNGGPLPPIIRCFRVIWGKIWQRKHPESCRSV